MSLIGFAIGIVLIFITLWDAFETVVLPRRVIRRFRLVRFFYHVTWPLWARAVRVLFTKKNHENIFGFYGPLSLLLLLVMWAGMLITGFGLLYWSLAHSIRTPEGHISFGSCLYFSGSSFFTLGLGDVAPNRAATRLLSVIEAGMGFGFLAIVISYLPAINQAFSRRETNISLLDARAGSPPTAGEILRRHNAENGVEALTELLREWERWCSDLLESHLSFPMLAYFRSQHDNQSWIAALTSILDISAFSIALLQGQCVRQARLTFAMARHAVVDLALVLYAAPREPRFDRLTAQNLAVIRALLVPGLRAREGSEPEQRLRDLRSMYEPYVYALSEQLLMPLPPWLLAKTALDNWQISAWSATEKEHF